MQTPSTLAWYALKVRTRSEALANMALREKAYETLLPTYVTLRHYSDRVKKVDTPLFPGYLFCRLDPEHRLPLLTTQYVDYILGAADGPHPIPEDEIAALRRVVATGAAARPRPYLAAGSRVRVQRGPFAGVEGLFMREQGTDQLIISITLLQRSVSVEIDRACVLPLQ